MRTASRTAEDVSAPMGFWDLDLAGRTMVWSDRALAILDRPAGALGADAFGWLQFVVEEDRAPLREAIERALTVTEGLTTEFRIVRTDGRAASVTMVGEHSGCGNHHMIGAITDVSRVKDLESRHRYAAKLEAMETIARAVAHAFNNSLTVIAGHTRLLLDDAVDDDVRQPVEQIAAAADRATALASQLLNFGRRPHPGTCALDVNAAVVDLSRTLNQITGDDVSLEIQIPPEIEPVSLGREELETLLVNLVNNARDATPRGGHIHVDVANTTVGEQLTRDGRLMPAGPAVSLRVTDEGSGMSDEACRQMLEPFYTTRGADDRMGLGLPAVMAILRDARGTITVDTGPGRATAVTVTLPRSEEVPVSSKRRSPQPSEPHATPSVLLVDDDESVMFFARVVLERAGYKVLTAVDPLEANRKFLSARDSGEHIAVLVTDIVLAGDSGLDLVLSLRELDSTLGVVFISGDGNRLESTAGLPGGVVLAKPFKADALVNAVGRVCRDAVPSKQQPLPDHADPTARRRTS